jgi:hypothetical protein
VPSGARDLGAIVALVLFVLDRPATRPRMLSNRSSHTHNDHELVVAAKITAEQEETRIGFGNCLTRAIQTFCARDNGVGYDMTFAHKRL